MRVFLEKHSIGCVALHRLDCFFHLCGSQPAFHKCRKAETLVDSMSIVNVFTPTQEECDKIQSGTVDTIPRELKLRILNEIPEVVRISVDMRESVAMLRGDRYVGSQQAKGQDFQFVIVQPATPCGASRFPIC